MLHRKVNQQKSAAPEEPTLIHESEGFREETYDVCKLTFKVSTAGSENSVF